MKNVITITKHNRNEWSRMAQAAYKVGRNDIGHRYSAAAAVWPDEVDPSAFDKMQSDYRAWLCFNEFPHNQLYA